MANTAQARKRMRQTATRNLRNRMRSSRVKTRIKNLRDLIASGDNAAAKELAPSVQKLIDQATSAGIYKKNTASRLKSTLAREVNALS